jgi:glyoxylase-like metal-dependent hydrolase (beta-lactamase superfamily II)
MTTSQVAPGVYAIPVGPEPAPGQAPAAQVYWVEGRDGGAFIDAGHGEPERTQALQDAWRAIAKGRKAKWVLLTDRYGEHAGGASALKAAAGAMVAAGRGDVERIEREAGAKLIDKAIDGGEAFDLGGRRVIAIATPGHTPGSVCYLIEQEGVLFSGDCILGTGLSTAVNPSEGGDMASMVSSLKKLQTLDLRLILSFHGPPITDPEKWTASLIARRQERDEQVLAALRDGASNPDAIRDRVYAGASLSERQWQSAREQVLAHLLKLEKEGKVRAVDGGKGYRLA